MAATYAGIQVTLTNADEKYRLLDLLQAVDPSITDAVFDLGIQAASTNSASVLVGDGLVSATRFAYSLSSGDARSYSRPARTFPLGSLYVRSSSAGQKLNVEVAN